MSLAFLFLFWLLLLTWSKIYTFILSIKKESQTISFSLFINCPFCPVTILNNGIYISFIFFVLDYYDYSCNFEIAGVCGIYMRLLINQKNIYKCVLFNILQNFINAFILYIYIYTHTQRKTATTNDDEVFLKSEKGALLFILFIIQISNWMQNFL